jgi:hypothetical protein
MHQEQCEGAKSPGKKYLSASLRYFLLGMILA